MPMTQAGRPLQIHTPLGDDALLIEKLSGEEAISTPFCVHLDLAAESPVAFEQLLGQSVAVSLDAPGCPRRYIHGLIAELREMPAVPSAAGTPWLRYQADLVPHLWLLSQRVQSRTFTEQTVPQILKKVLQDEWQLEVSFALQETYEPRPLCVQFEESDLAFVSRLMESEGIRYSFEHSADQDKLVVSDQPLAHPRLAGPALKLTRQVGSGSQPVEPAVTAWSKCHQVRAMKVTLSDRHLQLADKDLKAPQQLPHTVLAGQSRHTLNLGGLDRLETRTPYGGYAQKFDTVGKNGAWQPQQLQKVFAESGRIARIRMEEQACNTLTMGGTATAAHLVPGSLFALTAAQQADGEYLLTRVEHSAVQSLQTDADGSGFTYQNRFRCQPKDLPYRPARRTADEPIHFPIQATVVGDASTGNHEVRCDALGRVKVRFHWAGGDEDCSAWVPVSQAWAGNGYGSFFIPRVGNDVMIAFINGQKDRPVVIGSLHSNTGQPPFWNPNASPAGVLPLINGVRTRTIKGQDRDSHHFYFDDTTGAELVSLRSNRDLQLEVANDQNVTVSNDSSTLVMHDADATVKHDSRIYVGFHQATMVGLDQLVSGDVGELLLNPPKQADYTYGIRATVFGGMNTEVGIGSRVLCFMDPADYAVNKIWGGQARTYLKMLLTAVGGKTDVIYGNDTRISYGSLTRNFCRGQVFNSVLNFKGGEVSLSLLTVLHAATALAAIVLPAAQKLAAGSAAKSISEAAGIATLANTAALVGLKVLEKRYRYAAALLQLTGANQFLSTAGRKVWYASEVVGLVGPQLDSHIVYAQAFTTNRDGIMHQEVQGTYAIHAGAIQTICQGDIRTTAPTGQVVTIASGIAQVADSYKLVADAITIQSRRIVLQAGPDGGGQIEILPDKIVLTCGGSTLEIDPAKINHMSQIISQHAAALQAQH